MALAIDSQEASATAHRATSSPLTWSFNNVAGTTLFVGALITNISGGNAPSFGAVTDVTGSAI